MAALSLGTRVLLSYMGTDKPHKLSQLIADSFTLKLIKISLILLTVCLPHFKIIHFPSRDRDVSVPFVLDITISPSDFTPLPELQPSPVWYRASPKRQGRH